jgi:uncharacterized protein
MHIINRMTGLPARLGVIRAVLLSFLLLVAGHALAFEVPPLTGRVVDLADLLDPGQEAALVSELEAFEKKSSDQVVVLTIPSLEGDAIENIANKTFRTWALGKAQEDNGVLLLVARDDRKLRIEVGYGLEGSLTDALSGLIVRETIVPRFREGDFATGIGNGVKDILTVLTGDGAELEARAKRNLNAGEEIDWAFVIFMSIFVTVFFLAFFVPIMVRLFGKKIGPGRYKWHGMVVDTNSSGYSGGSSGGGWSSGGGGGGGFSGGGGSSGGGGASGGW